MRFVPHRNTSFQFSTEVIEEGYDSGYSSDTSLETESDIEGKDTSSSDDKIVTAIPAEDLQIATLANVLDHTQIQERFLLVSDAAALQEEPVTFETAKDQFERSLTRWAQLPTQSKADTRNESQLASESLLTAEKDIIESLNAHFAKQDLEVKQLVKEIQAERKRKQEEARRIAEEKARRLAEEERKKREEEERRRREEEAERQRKKVEEERKAKEAEELRKKQEAEATRLKVEEEARQAELTKLKLEEEKKALEANAVGLHNEIRIQREFLKYKQDIADIKRNVVEPLLANKELKQATNKIRRKINPKFGQLTNSRQKLLTVSNEVNVLVNEAKSISDLCFQYILNFIAKEAIKQAEVEVIVTPPHAVALAGLISNLLQVLPELSYYILARFYKKCPYLIGFTCPIDTEEGRIRMGWKRSNNKWEEESKYNERVGGIATLYAVLTRLNAPTTNNPISLSKSWLFLSRILNLKPELLADVHYILVANWWEACCLEFHQAYRSQGTKLLKLVSSDWLQLVENRKFSGYVRLRLLAEEWSQQGKIASFKQLEY